MLQTRNFRLNTPTALALVAAVLAVVAKLALTSGSLLPGLDGAYYWVQVRALVERGSLAFSDLPLLFWLGPPLSPSGLLS